MSDLWVPADGIFTKKINDGAVTSHIRGSGPEKTLPFAIVEAPATQSAYFPVIIKITAVEANGKSFVVDVFNRLNAKLSLEGLKIPLPTDSAPAGSRYALPATVDSWLTNDRKPDAYCVLYVTQTKATQLQIPTTALFSRLGEGKYPLVSTTIETILSKFLQQLNELPTDAEKAAFLDRLDDIERDTLIQLFPNSNLVP